MTKEEAIKVLNQVRQYTDYPKEAFTMAIDALSQPSLPSNLDEAAEKKARDIFESLEKHDIGEEKNRVLFGLLELEALALTFSHFGAEWMAGQGISADAEVCKLTERAWVTPINEKQLQRDLYDNFIAGDKVIVQIRKKQ